MTNEQKRIRGYEAVDLIIEEMTREVREKLQPYAKREGRKLDWWKGYFEGLVAAHCYMVYGRYPDGPNNQKSVEEAFEREKRRREKYKE